MLSLPFCPSSALAEIHPSLRTYRFAVPYCAPAGGEPQSASSADVFSTLLVGLTQDVAGMHKLCLSGVCGHHSCTVVSLV